MESRQLHKATAYLSKTVEWIGGSENEWTYFGTGTEKNDSLILNTIKDHLNDDEIVLIRKRENSRSLESERISEVINKLAGKEDFKLWNKNLDSVIEFSQIGILRKGKTIKRNTTSNKANTYESS